MKEILDFVVNAVRKEEQLKHEKENENKPKSYHAFSADVTAGDLIEPCKVRAAKHRDREAHYTKVLEEAEKELREKGISLEVYDQNTGTYSNFGNSQLSSGAVSANVQQFQPRVDQKLYDNVKNAKAKMLDHRMKAEEYEKLAAAFGFNKSFPIRLSAADINYFGLKS